jgi:O-antigen ligase
MIVRRPSIQRDLSFAVLLALAVLAALGIAYAVMRTSNPLLLLVAVVAGLGGVLIFLRPELGLLLLLFITFTRTPNVAPFIRDLPSISIALSIALGATLIMRSLFLGEKIGNWQTPVLFFGSYAVIGLATILWAAHPETVQSGLVEFVKDAVLALAVAMSIRRLETLRHVIWALLLAGLFIGTITVIQTLTSNYSFDFWGFGVAQEMNIVGGTSGIRISGPGMDPNTYGLYMILLVPLALDRAKTERNLILRVLALVIFAIVALTVVFTYSRGAFVTLAFSLGLYLVLHPPKPVYLILGLALLPVVILFAPPQYTQRLATLAYLLPGARTIPGEETVVGVSVQTAIQDVSFRGRLSENIVGLRMSMDHPILGVGLDNFKHHYLDYSSEIGLDTRRQDRGAHNLYLEFWAELGLMGILWFIALNWVSLRGLIASKKDLTWVGLPEYTGIATALAISLTALLFGSIFRHLTYPTYVWLFYGIVLAVPFVVKRELLGRQVQPQR